MEKKCNVPSLRKQIYTAFLKIMHKMERGQGQEEVKGVRRLGRASGDMTL